MTTESEAREKADQFRRQHALGSGPLGDLIGLVTHTCDVDIAILATGDDAHGMTVQHGDNILIGVARTSNPMRQRSTIAHELGHLVFDDAITCPPVWAERSPVEVRADAFARHLLLPIDGIRERCSGRTVNEQLLSDLVREWGASPPMVAIQLRDGGVVDRTLSQTWMTLTTPQLATRFGWSQHYKAMQAESDRVHPPSRLLARATKGYEEGVVSLAMLARLNGSGDLETTRQDLEEAGIPPVTPPAVPTLSSAPAPAPGFSLEDLNDLSGDDGD